MPTKVRANNSYSIPLYLKLCENFASRCSSINFPDTSDVNFPYTAANFPRKSGYLEADIQAVGLHIVGNKKLIISETSPLSVTWNGCFTQPGSHVMSLAINVVMPADNSRHLIFRREHVVKVDSFLSVSWAPMIALITPILVTVIQFLLRGG